MKVIIIIKKRGRKMKKIKAIKKSNKTKSNSATKDWRIIRDNQSIENWIVDFCDGVGTIFLEIPVSMIEAIDHNTGEECILAIDKEGYKYKFFKTPQSDNN